MIVDRGQNMKVLLVDDSDFMRQALKYLLIKRGLEVVEARNGKEGFEKAVSERPDLIISDILMPQVDGFRLLKNIKSTGTLKTIPVIFYSGVYTGEKEKELALALGAEDFIPKTKTPKELYANLEGLIERFMQSPKSKKTGMSLSEDNLAFLENYSKIISSKLEEKARELENMKIRLIKTQEQFQVLLSYTPAIIFRCETDLPYNTTFISENVKDIWGYTVQELMEDPEFWWKHVHPDDIPHIVEGRQHISDTEKGLHTLEYRFLCKDNTFKWVYSQARMLYDEAGQPAEIIGYCFDITARRQAEKALQQSLERLRKASGGIIDVIVMAVETRDPYTAGHQKKVSNLARSIATEMGLPEEQIDGIRMAGVIHDLGKISVPAEILSKPTKLAYHEFGIIKGHPQAGYDILKDIEFPWPLAQIVLQHHERLDGSGYPQGLKGDHILLEAKILAVADVVEAIASHRPYRPALGISMALDEIEKHKGIFYDAEVADTCLRLFREKKFAFE